MTCLDLSLDETETTTPGSVKHYIAPKTDVSAHSLVTEAYVYGTPVAALCGAVFVPSRNPDNLPLCRACEEQWNLIESSILDASQ